MEILKRPNKIKLSKHAVTFGIMITYQNMCFENRYKDGWTQNFALTNTDKYNLDRTNFGLINGIFYLKIQDMLSSPSFP